MSKLYNLAKMTTATTGTGTITLGSAVPGFLTFAQSGVQDGDVISYGIVDGSNREVGTGTYTSSGTTLTRTVINSTNSNSAITLSGTAVVFITALSKDIPFEIDYVENATTVTVTGTTSGSPTDVVLGNAKAYDGNTRIKLEFYTPMAIVNTGNVWIGLYDGSTLIGTDAWGSVHTAGNIGFPVLLSRFLTPSSGSHTYNVKAWKDADTEIRSTSSYGYAPIYLRITRA